MIDFHTYERVKLEDVAEYGRAKAGHVYPAGTSTLQISATKGQIGFLNVASQVESKLAVIIPQSGIDPRYFNYVMQKNVDLFMSRYKADINIQESDIGNFPIEVHNSDTQAAVVTIMWELDAKTDEAQHELDVMRDFKQTMLDKMMI
jgi:restriction endonuclease S subunit